jgi:hypothetical protein
MWLATMVLFCILVGFVVDFMFQRSGMRQLGVFRDLWEDIRNYLKGGLR